MKRDAPKPDTPPHSDMAEQGVLGSILVSNGAAILQCREARVEAAWFFVPAHALIFQQLCDAFDAGKPIELDTFTARLRAKNLLAQVGGAGFITELFRVVPTAATIDYYIGIVRDYYIVRESIRAAENVNQLARNLRPENEGNSPLPLLDEITARAESLRSLHGRNGTRISFRSPPEILAMPRNPKANFFGNCLLGVARSLVLAGIGGIGKSRLLLQLLVAFILERVWCGIETHHTKGQPWMLVQTQNGTQRLQDDLEALEKYAGRDWTLVEKNLFIHTLETDRDLMLHLSAPENVRDLESDIRQRNPIGVAFDPLNEVGIGDLSKDVDMQATCNVIGRVSRAGNPERAIVIATHAVTGVAGMKKAFGFEAAGFGRNSKVLGFWSRAFINIIPGKEDYSVLVFICAKNNDGQMFAPFAVRLNPDTKIYEPEPDFDIEGLREQLTATGTKKKPKFNVEMVKELVKFRGELDMTGLAKLIETKTGCGRSRSYELVHEGRRAKLFRFQRNTELYALA
jgi:hypothetical protein